VDHTVASDAVYLFREGTQARAYEHLGAHLDGDVAHFAVWAPHARRVSVVGDFNHWDAEATPLQPGEGFVWTASVEGVVRGQTYKFGIWTEDDAFVEKADPFAIATEVPPKTASVLWDLDYAWGDAAWFEDRGPRHRIDAPISIYEVHAGSWRKHTRGESYSFRDLAEELVPYVADLGFTHVEFLPLTEHPYFPSWGYQATSYFAPTARYGTPQDLMYLIDRLHQAGIGVILDWVPSHFATDGHGLGWFDGRALYEHPDWRRGWHPDWKSAVFDYGRPEVRSFLISSANFWLDRYHVDGLRVDAVASMLYLDYSRDDGEWVANRYGGKEHLEAIDFLRDLNRATYATHHGTFTVAEESTAWPMVSRPVDAGGLGFGYKWDMGWMHDTLDYFSRDPIYRRHHQSELTFRMLYAFNENFVLPLSHDEVVHGKGSLLRKMPGDRWQQFANLRALYGYMYGTVGKKLLFMGSEFAQWDEWSHDGGLQWDCLDDPLHEGMQRWVGDLNRLYRRRRALHSGDADPAGFSWISFDDAASSVIAFERWTPDRDEVVVVAAHFTPVPRDGYRIGVPMPGRWDVLLDSDVAGYGGSDRAVRDAVEADGGPWHGRPHSIVIDLPPLGVVFLAPG
jgi:1,4-alpha-glucan branching enzyme